VLPIGELSLVTPVTLSKNPTAEDIGPEIEVATQSVVLPTIWARRPRAGGCGYGGAVVQGTSRHSVLGYEDVKHPFFGA